MEQPIHTTSSAASADNIQNVLWPFLNAVNDIKLAYNMTTEKQSTHPTNLTSGETDSIQNVLHPFLKAAAINLNPRVNPVNNGIPKSVRAVGEFRYPSLFYSMAYYPVNQYRVQRIRWF